MATNETKTSFPISWTQRVILGIFGISSVAGGVYGIFKVSSTIGFTSLTLIGATALLFMLIGRWPDKFAFGGNSFEYLPSTAEDVSQKMYESAAEDAPPGKTIQLEDVRNIWVGSEDMGYPIYTYSEFDHALQNSLRRLFPNATLTRDVRIGTSIADYRLSFGSNSILIETKYLKPGAKEFKGVTLDNQIKDFPVDAKMVVVANVGDVSIARQKVHSHIDPKRAEVISWRGPRDDEQLLTTISLLVSPQP